ncbi:epithelial splicing regulatory protein 2-like isoform X2 [Elysia marginata]|uniref:Epithelial splicing regulatory protein 2-like isoform X2 n=1 Tax=Elysia marginata TaxID=1093978 RepID=A0AAV4G3L4_9GAST|nr:epithelial splicing regulatory protein 2-like isoform X2 [Elysia marginata]
MAALPHIVCFFVSTAGKNGDELGADEEQIVQIVYLLYDQNNNKVIKFVHEPAPLSLSVLFLCTLGLSRFLDHLFGVILI